MFHFLPPVSHSLLRYLHLNKNFSPPASPGSEVAAFLFAVVFFNNIINKKKAGGGKKKKACRLIIPQITIISIYQSKTQCHAAFATKASSWIFYWTGPVKLGQRSRVSYLTTGGKRHAQADI